MTTYNKVEIQGRIGYIRCFDFDNYTMAKISLATTNISHDDSLNEIMQIEWFESVVNSENIKEDLHLLKKGDTINITGSLHSCSRIDNETGNKTVWWQIEANSLKKITEE